ncbi:ribonuclease H-like domain-containing protein, partial [Tanacetum coccineum]
MFNDFFNPSTSVVSLVLVVAAAPRLVDQTCSPSSTSINQNSPSTSISSTQEQQQEKSLIISQGVDKQIKPAQFENTLFQDILNRDTTSQESSSNGKWKLENSQNNALAKLPMLKLGEYEMWEIRIKQYFQIQDYALWEVIENGNSWVPIPVTAPESGPSTTLKMTVPSTAEEKICKKNDVKAQSLLLMALPNEHQLTFNQYVDAQSMHQKLVSRLAILGVVTPLKDLNVKFLRRLPSEWDTHKVKRTVAANNDDMNMAFLTTSSSSSTNTINTVNTGVSTGTTKVNTASTETSTASFSDAIVYAFMSTQPQGSQLVHEDLEQLHNDDLEEMDLKWNMALLSMRARKFYQRTGRKIIIDGSNTAGYDKSKVECFNCHKMGHFSRECRAPRSKDNKNWNQGSSSKAVKIEDASEKAMCAIDGAGFDWSDIAEDEIQANMALMAFIDSEVSIDKSYDTGFKAATYKRGLSILEAQVVKYKESEVIFSEEIALLKRSVGHKEYLMGLLKTELEKVKEEKEGFEFKIAKFKKSSKDLDDLLASQVTDKSKKGFGYNVVPSPHPLILNRPTPLDLSYSGLEEFKQPKVNEYGPRDSSLKPTTVYDRELENSKENTDDSLKQQHKTITKTSFVKENTDAPIIEDWVSDDEEEVEPIPKVEKKTSIPTATKKESVKPEKPIRSCPKHMVPRAVLMKTGLKTVNNARPINTVRSVNTGRPFSTARSFNTVRPSYTAHHKSIVHCVRPRTYFQNQAQSTVQRPFYKRTTLAKRSYNQNVNTIRVRGFNAVKPSVSWVWRPIKPNGASLVFNKYNYIDTRGRSKSVMAWISKTLMEVMLLLVEEQIDAELLAKDASYFDDALPRFVADAQIQDQSGFHDEIDDLEKSHDDSNLQNNGTADQQVNTARPEVNTSSREVSTAVTEVNTAAPEDLVGPSPTSEDTQVEDQEI